MEAEVVQLPYLINAERPDDQRAGAYEAFAMVLQIADRVADERIPEELRALTKPLEELILAAAKVLLNRVDEWKLQEEWQNMLRVLDVHKLGLNVTVDGWIVMISELGE